MHIPAYIKKLVFSIAIILAVINFTKTTLTIVNRSKRLDNLKSEVTQLEEQRSNLQQELEYKKSQEFVIEEARNKLGLVRPREELFVVSRVLGDESYSEENTQKISNKSNAQRWLDLFL